MYKFDEPRVRRALEDREIVDLYWARDEQAISETDFKYKRYLLTIAYNILHDRLDCEECLNDTYLGTWNTIPPERPSFFQSFISKIMRNTAVVRYKKNTADKRIKTEMIVSMQDLEASLPDSHTVEEEYAATQISRILSDYLRSLPERSSFIFICRYYCSDRVADIAEMLHISESTVFRELKSLKKGLRERLEREGYHYA